MRAKIFRNDERGAALLEFAIGGAIFMSAMFGVLEVGRLLWAHNSLVDATRRAARYAVNQGMSTASQTEAKNMAVYGNAAGTGQPLVQDLTVSQVKITYQNFELGGGTVTAEIEDYDFKFVLPLVSKTLRLPAYKTSLTAENAGYVPTTIP
ncbi:MAG TPA: TadE/TadG family type IV pilus assembly protein [Pyrinomonadaceae bacterium]|nr:TadE/TadG family type IV pilus assembly protein [Pyrinomonadaceae bacterium]